MSERRWIAVLLLALVFGVFGRVGGHEFVDYDDLKHIVRNPDLADGLTLESAARVFTRPHYRDAIPLTYVSLQLDRTLFGPEPAGTLLVNVALHAASTLLLFFALARMTGATWRPAFVAAVFAVHPLHVESVAWAFERKDVLSGLFWMLALWFYARAAETPDAPKRLRPVAWCLAAGLLAKPMLVTLPFALLLLDFWPLRRLGTDAALVDRAKLRDALVEKWPLFALVAAAVALTLFRHAGASVHAGAEMSLATRLANVPEAYFFYLWKSVWPLGLSVYYPHPFDVDTARALRAAALGVGLLAASAGALWLARRRPYVPAGWLWFLGTLVPVIGIVQLGYHSVADRYMYLPQVGLAWLVAWGAVDLVGERRAARRALAAAAVGAVGALALLAWAQVGTWRDTRTLFEHALEVHEDDFHAHWRLGVLHAQAGELPEALTHLREAARAEPELAATHHDLAQTLEKVGDLELAFEHYERALAIDPRHARANGRYGLALLELGRNDDARPRLQRALESDPEQPRVHGALAAVYAASGRDAEAERHYRAARRLEPGYAPVANNLALLLATSEDASVRRPREAIRLAQEALEMLPGEPAVMDTLAVALASAGRVEEAIDVASRALELARARGDRALVAEIEGHLAGYRKSGA